MTNFVCQLKSGMSKIIQATMCVPIPIDGNTNNSEIHLMYEPEEKDMIEIAIKFIKAISSKTIQSVVTIKSRFIFEFNQKELRNFFELYQEFQLKMFFDGRSTIKEIYCPDDKFKEYTKFILVMCKNKLYSGYHYDAKTKRITVYHD